MTNIPRVLLVASKTGYQTRMFADAAERAGVDLVLATDRCHILEDPWGDRALPLRFDAPQSAPDVVAPAGPLDGIVAVGDRPAYIAAIIADALGLRFHPARAVAICRNKFAARQRFRDASLLVPEFYRVPVEDGPAGSPFYPCVLKPLGMSASRGVIRADSDAEFKQAFQRIRALLNDPETRRMHEEQDRYVQVESFIPGREFALEGIATEGRLHAIALFDKPDPLDGPYFEETIYVTPSRQSPEVQRAIIDTTQRAISALGLTNGPIHAELRVNDRGVWMLEIAARPIGGLCAKAVPGLEESILRHSAGVESAPLLLKGAHGVMMIPVPRAGVYAGVEGVDYAAAVEGITEVVITAKEGQTLLPLPEGNSYAGFIFARGGSAVRVEDALRTAHAHLRFEITAALPVL